MVVKNVVPFLKVDKGLADEADGVQVMKPMPGLDELLARANEQGRVRHQDALGHQAREPGRRRRRSSTSSSRSAAQILGPGLVPIIEPEVDIHSPEKAQAEELLKAAILAQLGRADRRPVGDAEAHAARRSTASTPTSSTTRRCCGSSALSGGYSRDEANARLARNHGVIASFSRALTEGLSAQQSDAEFDAALDASIESIYDASIT